MIGLGSNNWSSIFGNNFSSDDLNGYTLEIDGVDYLISEIKLGIKTPRLIGGILEQLPNIPLVTV